MTTIERPKTACATANVIPMNRAAVARPVSPVVTTGQTMTTDEMLVHWRGVAGAILVDERVTVADLHAEIDAIARRVRG